MKLRITTLLLSVMALVLCTIGIPAGCTTGTNNTTAKAEAVIIPSVNVAMELWKSHVLAGKATQAQMDNVKTAYVTYYNSQLVLKAALEKSIASKLPSDEAATEAAIRSATAAKAAILNLLNSLLK